MSSALHTSDPIAQAACRGPVILIDGVIYQIYPTAKGGIARVWMEAIPRLVKLLPHCTFVYLRRAGTETVFPEIAEVTIPTYYSETMHQLAGDEEMLSSVCKQHDADLLLSTYYSTARDVPSVLMAHDLIPEVMNFDMTLAMWASKERAFLRADSFVAVSESTQRDLHTHYGVAPESVTVAYHGVSDRLRQATRDVIDAFKQRYAITKPYFMMVGLRGGYKNGTAALEAFITSPLRHSATILLVGGEMLTEGETALYGDAVIRIGSVSDEDLAAAYSGACALLYPSLYEGFGIPILEAFACGCPVITTSASSLPEVGGDACIYVKSPDPAGIRDAMECVMDPPVRAQCIERGFAQVKKFSWEKSAQAIAGHVASRLTAHQDRISGRIGTSKKRESLLSDVRNLLARGERLQAGDLADQAVLASPQSYRSFLAAADAHAQDPARARENLLHAWEHARFDPVVAHDVITNLSQFDAFADVMTVLCTHLRNFPFDAKSVFLSTTAAKNWASAIIAQSRVQKTRPETVSLPRMTVIVTDTGPGLPAMAASLARQTIAAELEVIALNREAGEAMLVASRNTGSFMRITVVEPPRQLSVAEGLNLGVLLSKSEYCTHVGSRDMLGPRALEDMARSLGTAPDDLIVFGTTHLTEQDNASFESYRAIAFANDGRPIPVANFTDHLFSFGIGPFIVWRRIAHEIKGFFDPAWGVYTDLEFWVRVGCSHRPQFLDKLVRVMRASNTLSSQEALGLKSIFDIYTAHHNLTHKLHLANLLMKLVVMLIDANRSADARALFGACRGALPPMRELERIDELMSQLGI